MFCWLALDRQHLYRKRRITKALTLCNTEVISGSVPAWGNIIDELSAHTLIAFNGGDGSGTQRLDLALLLRCATSCTAAANTRGSSCICHSYTKDKHKM
jgi:hypothetical protein